MKFSLALGDHSAADFAAIAVQAERLGFEAIWVSNNHLVVPIHATSRHPWAGDAANVVSVSSRLYDPWVLLGFIAAHTSSIKLATGVYVLPLVHPLVTARAVASVQLLSRGRVMFGVGVGWLAEEFDAVGVDFDSRGSRSDEILQILETLWSGNTLMHRGSCYTIGPVAFGNIPARIPIIVGGTSARAKRRAARLGDGWVVSGGYTLKELARARTEVDRLREECGRSELPFTHFVPLNGGYDRANLRRYEDAGFSHIRLSLPISGNQVSAPLEQQLSSIAALANTLGISGDKSENTERSPV